MNISKAYFEAFKHQISLEMNNSKNQYFVFEDSRLSFERTTIWFQLILMCQVWLCYLSISGITADNDLLILPTL